MKKGIGVVLGTLVLFFPYIALADTLIEFTGSNDDQNNYGAGLVVGQSFKVASDSCVTGVSMWAKRDASFETVAHSTWITTQLAAGGPVIATTTGLTTFVPSTSYEWSDVTFDTSATLTATTQYYYYVKAGGSTNNVIRWAHDATSPSYSDGTVLYNYSTDASIDAHFRVYGTVGACAVGGGDVVTYYPTASSTDTVLIEGQTRHVLIVFIMTVLSVIFLWDYLTRF